ncbi:MAG: hypothetical protein LC808_29155 [Actinobacteria bacterium]|nr:hypothetical protein [Actinomycetota bacterium]
MLTTGSPRHGLRGKKIEHYLVDLGGRRVGSERGSDAAAERDEVARVAEVETSNEVGAVPAEIRQVTMGGVATVE